MMAFYETHYTSAAMRLVMVAKEPLDEMQETAEVTFGRIPDRYPQRWGVGEDFRKYDNPWIEELGVEGRGENRSGGVGKGGVGGGGAEVGGGCLGGDYIVWCRLNNCDHCVSASPSRAPPVDPSPNTPTGTTLYIV
jgi:hypothetical protein